MAAQVFFKLKSILYMESKESEELIYFKALHKHFLFMLLLGDQTK